MIRITSEGSKRRVNIDEYEDKDMRVVEVKRLTVDELLERGALDPRDFVEEGDG